MAFDILTLLLGLGSAPISSKLSIPKSPFCFWATSYLYCFSFAAYDSLSSFDKVAFALELFLLYITIPAGLETGLSFATLCFGSNSNYFII